MRPNYCVYEGSWNINIQETHCISFSIKLTCHKFSFYSVWKARWQHSLSLAVSMVTVTPVEWRKITSKWSTDPHVGHRSRKIKFIMCEWPAVEKTRITDNPFDVTNRTLSQRSHNAAATFLHLNLLWARVHSSVLNLSEAVVQHYRRGCWVHTVSQHEKRESPECSQSVSSCFWISPPL